MPVGPTGTLLRASHDSCRTGEYSWASRGDASRYRETVTVYVYQVRQAFENELRFCTLCTILRYFCVPERLIEPRFVHAGKGNSVG